MSFEEGNKIMTSVRLREFGLAWQAGYLHSGCMDQRRDGFSEPESPKSIGKRVEGEFNSKREGLGRELPRAHLGRFINALQVEADELHLHSGFGVFDAERKQVFSAIGLGIDESNPVAGTEDVLEPAVLNAGGCKDALKAKVGSGLIHHDLFDPANATSNGELLGNNAAKQVLNSSGLINQELFKTLRAEFTEEIAQEMLLLPHVNNDEVPEYFDDKNNVIREKLPAYLQGLEIDLAKHVITRQELNLLIYEALVLPAGREELFDDSEPGRVHNYEANIELMDTSPWYARLRPMAQEDKLLFEEVLMRYLKQGLIEKAMKATNCVNAMLVKKPSGRNQLAFDYRELNRRVSACLWPLPLLGDCLDCMSLAIYLTSLDVNGAYFSIPVAEGSRDHLAFLCPYGIYRWTRLPYGYKNSGPIFCNQIFESLMGLVYSIVSLYADDSKIFGGSTVRMHIKCISLCLTRLHKWGFKLSLKKCLFFVREMDHLGFTAVAGGTKPTQRNVKKIQGIQIKKIKDIRGFIGLSNYYRRYVKGYSQIIAPLLPYLRKDARLPKVLPVEVQSAVDAIKQIVSSYPVLRNPDFKREFILETDGSKHGFGAVLKQAYDGVEFICAYGSAHILKSQLKYTSDMLELVAAVWGMKHYHHYLRKKFILKTDNVILKWLRKKSIDNTKPSFIRWVLEAQEYDFEVVHVPGKQLVAGDLMSRAGARDSAVDPLLEDLENSKYFKLASKVRAVLNREVKGTKVYAPLDREIWMREQAEDPRLMRMLKGKTNLKHFELVDGIWHHRENPNGIGKLRVVVPAALRATLMAVVHSLLGHRGVKPIVKRLSQVLYWPGIWAYARAWIGSCSDCKRRKMSRVRQPWVGDVKHITTPWYFVAIDFVLGELPLSPEGYKYCLTVMCVFTRFPFALPLRTKEPDEIASALYTWVFSIFGFPVVVHSDHDSTLISQALELVFKRFGVRRSFTLWSHPQSNGHLERFHRYMNETMAIVLPRYPDWPEMLAVVMFAYRSMVQETTGYSPHYLNFGRDALMPLEVTWCLGVHDGMLKPADFTAASQEYAERLVSRLQGAFQFVRRAQQLASTRNKEQTAPKSDRVVKRGEPIHFEIGDSVYLREDTSVHNKVGVMREVVPNAQDFVPMKWRFKWTGPHIVLKAIGQRAYVIHHSQRREELDVHVDDLRPHVAFAHDLVDTAQVSAYVTPKDLAPPLGYNEMFPNAAGAVRPSIDDLCLAHIPLFTPEDFAVIRYLGEDEFQWYSSTFAGGKGENDWDSYTVLERTTWLPGWLLAPEFQRVQYVFKQPEGSRPWICTIEELPYGLMLWGFELTSSGKVRKPIVDWVRQVVRPSNTTKPRHGGVAERK